MECISSESAPIAQRLEQGTHNPLVAGSNPAGRTKPASHPGGGYFFGPALRAQVGQYKYLRFCTAKAGFSLYRKPPPGEPQVILLGVGT